MTTAEASAPPPPENEAAAAAAGAKEQQHQPAAEEQQDGQIDELDELIDFLGDGHRAEVRLEACRLVEGLTGDAAGSERLRAAAARLLPPLLRRATEDGEERPEAEGSPPASSSSSPPSSSCRRPALAALVNLSQEPGAAKAMLDLGAVQRAMDCLREQQQEELRGAGQSPSASTSLAPSSRDDAPSRSDMLLMLLSNLTALEQGASLLLQLGRDRVEGFNLAVLLHRFLRGEGAEGVAALLANATALPDGRRLLVGPSGAFGAVARAAFGGDGGGASPPLSPPARRAAAAALRNCCLAASRDGTVEEILKEGPALSAMLRALCGERRVTEEGGQGEKKPRKIEAASGAAAWAGTGGAAAAPAEGSTKDPDPEVRAALAEAVLVLAADDERGRPRLWELDAPELLRQGYEDEEDAGTCEALERTAELFLAGAGGVDEVAEEGGEGGGEEKEEREMTEDERRRRGRTGMMRA